MWLLNALCFFEYWCMLNRLRNSISSSACPQFNAVQSGTQPWFSLSLLMCLTLYLKTPSVLKPDCCVWEWKGIYGRRCCVFTQLYWILTDGGLMSVRVSARLIHCSSLLRLMLPVSSFSAENRAAGVGFLWERNVGENRLTFWTVNEPVGNKNICQFSSSQQSKQCSVIMFSTQCLSSFILLRVISPQN